MAEFKYMEELREAYTVKQFRSVVIEIHCYDSMDSLVWVDPASQIPPVLHTSMYCLQRTYFLKMHYPFTKLKNNTIVKCLILSSSTQATKK